MSSATAMKMDSQTGNTPNMMNMPMMGMNGMMPMCSMKMEMTKDVQVITRYIIEEIAPGLW